jgi:hypothetical protein
MEELLIIEIPGYITHVELSKSRRKKYFCQDDDIPKRYQNDSYEFIKGKLCHSETGRPVIKNNRSAGTPKLKKINGQDFYSGNVMPQVRAKIIHEMKKFFYEHFEGIPPIDPEHFPIEMELEIHYTIKNDLFDIDNLGWVYTKVIQDVLKDTEIIPDDNIQYIRKSGGCQFVQVDTEDDRKILIKIKKNVYQPVGIT